MLANDYDDPSNDLVTPGVSDFQQASRRIELCTPRARIGESKAKAPVTSCWMDDRPLLECFTYYINYHESVKSSPRGRE